MITLSRLYIHPVKSMRGLRLSHAHANQQGLEFDRHFMLTRPDGTFITARKYPQMLLFTPAMTADGLFLQAPDGEKAHILYADFLPEPQPTNVWGNQFAAHVAPETINDWLSRYFDHQVHLRWLGHTTLRRIKKHPDIPLSFADGYPYLLINEASFYNLQQRCSASIQLEQFRGNLIVTGAQPFEEDTWETMKIGEVTFSLVKACSRCILTTVSPESGKPHPSTEPLATLQTFRTAQDGDIDFGQNALALTTGIIRVGDPITVLTHKQPKSYQQQEILISPTSAYHQEKLTLTMTLHDQIYTVNNRETILEQLEKNNIEISYSCRAGICGSCKIKLINGEVTPLKPSAIKLDGTILACSCLPKTDITLETF